MLINYDDQIYNYSQVNEKSQPVIEGQSVGDYQPIYEYNQILYLTKFVEAENHWVMARFFMDTKLFEPIADFTFEKWYLRENSLWIFQEPIYTKHNRPPWSNQNGNGRILMIDLRYFFDAYTPSIEYFPDMKKCVFC